MSLVFTTSKFVEFSDTDMAGIAHFSAFFRYMESAEHAYIRSQGLSVYSNDDESPISWPRVAARCDYQSPAFCEDVLEIEIHLRRLGTKSVTYGFVFTKEGIAVAEGEMSSVCCRIIPGQPPQPIAIPDWIREKIGQD
jgi:4-hydroxybenzoyl-CoA thioesterase/acyl-CoA thioester hydrolase